MAGKTQKERREIRKHKHNIESTVSCPICLENTIKKNQIKLDCGHIFCNNCLDEFNKSEIHSKLNNRPMGILAPIGMNKGIIPLMVFTNDDPIVKCAICRTEYMCITIDMKPQKVLIKVKFADVAGLTPNQYI